MLELSYLTITCIVLCAFLFGVAVCYVYGLSKISDQANKTSLWALDVLENTQDLLDDTKHIQDKLDKNNKSIPLDQAVGLVLMDENWEIDSVFDDISGRTTVFEPDTILPIENSIVIELDETTEYTIVVPKRVLNAIRRALRIREAQQRVSALPYSTRPSSHVTDRAKPTMEKAIPGYTKGLTEGASFPSDGTQLLNPLLIAAAQQNQEKAS